MYVYVLNKNGKPLMPTQRGNRVRILLKQGLAKVVYQKPFTIQLTYEVENPEIQPLFGGTDSGRTNIGEAVIKKNGETVYASEVETSNKDVPKHMKERASHRRASRTGERKVRQRRAIKNNTTFKEGEIRKRILPGCEEPIENHCIINTEARFMNRKRPAGWLTPTARHLVQTHLNMVDKICRILPITDWTLEINKFAFMKMKDRTIKGIDYQNGRLRGFASINDYVYNEQSGKCACCDNPIKHYHHIIERHNGGSDTPENIVGVCDICHEKVHTKKMQATFAKIGQKKKYSALSVLNQAIPYIYESLVQRFGEKHVHTCFGWQTQELRKYAHLEKEHYIDAQCIASTPLNIIPKQSNHIYKIKQFRRHDRAIINNQRERTYFLDGMAIAKNRKHRFEQENDSLNTFLEQFPEKERRTICSRLTVKRSTRRYNNLKRLLPGCIFFYEGKRYVMTGQLNSGSYLRAYGMNNKNFKTSECKVFQSGGLIYI